MGRGYVLRVEGPNPCSSWVTQGTFPLHNFPLYNALSPTVHLNGSNGTDYTRPSMVQNRYLAYLTNVFQFQFQVRVLVRVLVHVLVLVLVSVLFCILAWVRVKFNMAL